MDVWQYQELFGWFLEVCWAIAPAAYAAGFARPTIKHAYYDLIPEQPAEGYLANARDRLFLFYQGL